MSEDQTTAKAPHSLTLGGVVVGMHEIDGRLYVLADDAHRAVTEARKQKREASANAK